MGDQSWLTRSLAYRRAFCAHPRQRDGLSGRTLEKHRTYGTGPKYRKIGGRVVYGLDDLKAWADLGAKTSTSDPGAGTVFPAKRVVAPGHVNGQPHRR
jgi:hypothetical protein